MLQLPFLWPPCARVSLQGQGQRIREGHRQGKGKGHEHLRADPQQREGQGEIQGANVWNLLDMRRRALRGELLQGQGQVGEPEVFDQREPEEWGTLSHIQERMLDPKPEGASKEGWTLIDFVKKRRRQGEVKKAKKEKAQELRIIRTIEPETVSRRWTAARRRP